VSTGQKGSKSTYNCPKRCVNEETLCTETKHLLVIRYAASLWQNVTSTSVSRTYCIQLLGQKLWLCSEVVSVLVLVNSAAQQSVWSGCTGSQWLIIQHVCNASTLPVCFEMWPSVVVIAICSVWEYAFCIFFRISKSVTFYVFEMICQKVVSKSLVLSPSKWVHILRSVITVIHFSYLFVSLLYLRTYRRWSHTQLVLSCLVSCECEHCVRISEQRCLMSVTYRYWLSVLLYIKDRSD